MSVRSHQGLEGGLLRRLRRLGRRIELVADVRGVGWGLVVVLGLLVGGAWLDLLSELSPRVRLGALGLGALAFLATLLVAAIGGWRASRPAKVARTVDRTARTGGEVLTGLDLLGSPAAPQPVTEGLRRLAVRRAGELAGSVAAPLLAPLRTAARPFRWLILGLACVAAVALVAPRLLRTEWVRTLMPWVDEPPYSPYEFLVDPGDAQVFYGDTLDVHVRFGSVKPEQVEMLVELELVLRGDEASLLHRAAGDPPAGRSPSAGEGPAGQGAARGEVLPMFQESDGSWRGQLRELTVPVRYTVRAPRGRTRGYRVGLIYTPQLTKVTFRLTPPAYTQLPPQEGPLPEKGLAGLVGTRVDCVVESNRPLRGGDLELEWQDGRTESVTLSPAKPGAESVQGYFVIADGGRFQLGVRDVEGRASRTRMTGAIVRLQDQRPFVRIVEPLTHSLATPTATLPVIVEADDDFGVTQLWLYRSLNDSRDLPLKLTKEGQVAARLRAEVQLPLDLYKLSPNDVLTFYARVQDNDPNAPKGAESELVRVTVISQEDFDKLTRAKATLQDMLTKYESQSRSVDALRQRLQEDLDALRALDAKSPEAVESVTRELKDLSQALAEEARQARELASAPPLFDLDQSLSDALRELADAASQAAARVARAGQSVPGASAVSDMEEAQRLLGGGAERYAEETLAPLEALERVYPLIEDAHRFAALYLRQKELARRMAARGWNTYSSPADLAGPEGKVRMADLSDEQAELREQLAELLEDIRAHELQCPDEEAYAELKATAREFVEAVDASEADEEMQAVGTSLAALDAETAARHADSAEHILAQFVAQCLGGLAGQGERALRFQPGLEQGLGNTLAQLLGSAGLGFAGFGGMGAGAMGGYSVQASTLDNVGLYGSSEAQSPSAGMGSRDRASRGISIDLASDRSGAGGVRVRQEDASSGAALLEVVPPEYRTRVQAYFRRVAEETSAQPAGRRPQPK